MIGEQIKKLEDWKQYYENLYNKTNNKKHRLKFLKISKLLRKVHREDFKRWSGKPSKLDNMPEGYLEKLLEEIIGRKTNEPGRKIKEI